MQIDQLPVMQLVHDVNFLLDQLLLHCSGNGDEFGREVVSGGTLAASVDDAECACAYNSGWYLMPLWVWLFKMRLRLSLTKRHLS